MAINFKLREKREIDQGKDPMGRAWVGYEPTMTADAVFEQNRGVWYLGEPATHERYVTFSFDGKIVGVGEIHDIRTLAWPDQTERRRKKQVVEGRALGPGDSAYDYFIDRVIDTSSRNPVGYLDDPSVGNPRKPRTCLCGCGVEVAARKKFVAGHDQRAVHARILEGWGDIAGFIEWFDSEYRQAMSQ